MKLWITNLGPFGTGIQTIACLYGFKSLYDAHNIGGDAPNLKLVMALAAVGGMLSIIGKLISHKETSTNDAQN